MASVGRKLANLQNLARGRNSKKKTADFREGGFYLVDDSDMSRDYAVHPDLFDSQRKVLDSTSSLRGDRPSMSGSVGSINSDSMDGGIVDQDEILSLTHDVRNFSDALTKMKAVFSVEEAGTVNADSICVTAHGKLGELLFILKTVLQKYPTLHSTDVLSAAGQLITKIKNFPYEDSNGDFSDVHDTIDHLALAFSSSISDYLMGFVEVRTPPIGKTRSYENLSSVSSVEMSSPIDRDESNKIPAPVSKVEDLDTILLKLDTGVDLALNRAKSWSKYAKDITYYVDKKAHLEAEYAKNLTKLAQHIRPLVTEEVYLPLQSDFCLALDQDVEYASTRQATSSLIQSQKFVEPLNNRRAYHDKTRKTIKETWTREQRRMHDAVSNLKKAKNMYIMRQVEYEKARDSAQRAEHENLTASTGATMGKLDKKRKLEEEAMHKAVEAETTYKACVAEANHRQQELERVKGDVLSQLRELMFLSEQVMKMVTVSYFQLQHTVASPLPAQLQAICESNRGYEPGDQYIQYVRHLPRSANHTVHHEPFVFEPYSPDHRLHENSSHSSGSTSDVQVFVDDTSSHKDKGHGPVKAWSGHSGQGGSDSDSVSGSSSRSHDSSPSASPFSQIRRTLPTSASFDELAELTASLGLAGDFIKAQKSGKNITFGVDFATYVKEHNTEIPYIVRKCVDEIEKRGITLKGIYRVSGVKSRVERQCQAFETYDESVDLSDQHPNVISSVLKLYLSQLPEPLFTYKLYPEFIKISKDDTFSEEKVVQNLQNLVKQFPKANLKTTAFLIHHLMRVTEQSEENHMNASNLGIVFGPTLLRPLDGDASMMSLMDTPHKTRVVEQLITHCMAIFGPQEETVVESIGDSTIKLPSSHSVKEKTVTETELSAVVKAGETLMEELIKGTQQDDCDVSVPLPGSVDGASLKLPRQEESIDVGDDLPDSLLPDLTTGSAMKTSSTHSTQDATKVKANMKETSVSAPTSKGSTGDEAKAPTLQSLAATTSTSIPSLSDKSQLTRSTHGSTKPLLLVNPIPKPYSPIIPQSTQGITLPGNASKTENKMPLIGTSSEGGASELTVGAAVSVLKPAANNSSADGTVSVTAPELCSGKEQSKSEVKVESHTENSDSGNLPGGIQPSKRQPQFV